MKKDFIFKAGFLLAFIGHFACQAQPKQTKLTKVQKQQVIATIGKLMKDNYVFPKVADKMAAYLEKQYNKNLYGSIESPNEFGQALTRDLYTVSKDKHISVRFNPEIAQKMANRKKHRPNPDLVKRRQAQNRRRNYGFQKIEILAGNIGYINLKSFSNHKEGMETVASAMVFLANTEGVIIDLRQNGGGSPRMVQLICSYFFGNKSVHLNSLYWRRGNRTEEFWTLKKVKGQRMPNKPLYILTSKYTFSAAEEFSYNMRNLQRATLVGETTGGGANPGGGYPIEGLYTMFVPTGRAINPITKTNWEGVGVKPHIPTSANQALDRAHLELLKSLKHNSPALTWVMQGLKAKASPVRLSPELLKTYAGEYTNRRISLKNGALYYQRPSLSKSWRKLTPLSEELFALDGVDYFRVKFVKGSNGKISSLEGLYQQGNRDISKRGSITE